MYDKFNYCILCKYIIMFLPRTKMLFYDVCWLYRQTTASIVAVDCFFPPKMTLTVQHLDFLFLLHPWWL